MMVCYLGRLTAYGAEAEGVATCGDIPNTRMHRQGQVASE